MIELKRKKKKSEKKPTPKLVKKKIKLRIGIFTSGSKLTINRSVIVYDLRLKKCENSVC